MRIVIDARMMGHDFGIGVYTKELCRRLAALADGHKLIFLLQGSQMAAAKESLKGDRANIELVECNIKHYSFKEQFVLPGILKKLKPDLVHFPNFNVPVFYQGNFVVTIHDMVHHKVLNHRNGRPFHRWAYKMVMKKAVTGSRAIITISKASKQDILEFFPQIDEKKVFVISEGVGPEFNPTELPGEIYSLREKYGVIQPYLLFVGVWEVKKNLPFLAKVFAKLAVKFPELKLVLAGKPDPWHPEVKRWVKHMVGASLDRLIMPGFVASQDLPALYRQSLAFISASPNEGFGLPGLEAMACGKPVAVADTSVFREVYGPAAEYFSYQSRDQAVDTLAAFLSNKQKQAVLSQKAVAWAQKYTWEDTAARTLQLYESI